MATLLDLKWIKDGASGRMDEDGIITFNESAIATFNEVVNNSPDAIAVAGFQQGQEHRDNVNLVISGAIDAEPLDVSNGTQWRFDIEYTTSGFGQSNTTGNAENRATVKFGTWTYTQVVETDKSTGEAIVNTAGDPFDPMPEEVIASPIVTVTLRQNSPNIQRINDIGSVNDAQVTIAGISFPANTAMLANYEPEPFTDEEGFTTFFNTYTIKGCFKVNKDNRIIGWTLELLSQGFNQINDEGERAEIKIRTAKDEEDLSKGYDYVPIAQPAMLTDAGKPTTSPSAAAYQEFQIHRSTNFSSFRLPTSFPR